MAVTEPMIEIPVVRAQLFGKLLAAGRVWRASLIPGTSSGLQGPTARLIEALEAFDECDHPRGFRVYRQQGDVQLEECGKCGLLMTTETETGDPDDEPRPDGGSGGTDQGGG